MSSDTTATRTRGAPLPPGTDVAPIAALFDDPDGIQAGDVEVLTGYRPDGPQLLAIRAAARRPTHSRPARPCTATSGAPISPRTRLAFDPIDRLLAARHPRFVDPDTGVLCENRVASLLGLPDSKLVNRARTKGMRPATADRIADAAGYHPSAFWPNWLAIEAQLELGEIFDPPTTTKDPR